MAKDNIPFPARLEPGASVDTDTDILRILASFFVVLIHVSGSGSSYALILNCISRFSVPVFVFLSGRYVLAKKPEPKRLLRKGIHLFALMLFWAMVFYCYHSLGGGGKPEASFPVYLLTEPVHLWYIWAMIALYLMAPLLQVFCENAQQSTYRYALLFTFVSGTIITLLLRANPPAVLTAIIDRSKLPYQLGFVFCFLFGDYYRRFRPGITVLSGAALFAAGTLGTVAGTLYLSRNAFNSLLMSFFSPTVICAAIGIYAVITQLPVSPRKRCRQFLHELAGCTPGVYLIHPLALSLSANAMASVMHSLHFLYLPVYAMVAYLISIAFVCVVRKIPLLRKVFG